MAELDARLEQLECDLGELKTDVKALLVELKMMVAKDQNPLEAFSKALSRPTRDGPVAVVSPATGV